MKQNNSSANNNWSKLCKECDIQSKSMPCSFTIHARKTTVLLFSSFISKQCRARRFLRIYAIYGYKWIGYAVFKRQR